MAHRFVFQRLVLHNPSLLAIRLAAYLTLLLWPGVVPELFAQAPEVTPHSIQIGPKFARGELLVRFKQGTSSLQKLTAHYNVGANVLSEWELVPGLVRVQLPSNASLAKAIASYRKNEDVLYAEPNYAVHIVGSPNDAQFASQWSLLNVGQFNGTAGADIHAIQAWDLTTGSSNVVVGVIDTGADYNHPDLSPNIWTADRNYSGTNFNCPAGSHGFNALTLSCNPMDDHGHGTHVSGIIGAVGNNATGVTGVNWHVQIIPCKFLDANGGGYLSGALACLDFMKSLRDAGVPIIATNNSYGDPNGSQALNDAIVAQATAGILFVAAAGNQFSDNDVWFTAPSDIYAPNIISVAATTRNDTVAGFSNLGSHTVHLGAPGQEILSTLPSNTYGLFSGTSMAAPEVTGVAALLKAYNPSLDWRAIRNLVLSGGDPTASLSQTITGRRLNAYGAMTCSGNTVQRRIQPTIEAIPAIVGESIELAAFNINCGQPAGLVQVTVQPGGQTITLKDDGVAPDQSAGDGIYEGTFTPSAYNNYVISFPWGDQVQIVVLKTYAAAEDAPYNYRTFSGTNLNLGDDDAVAVNPPFPVHFGGGAFSKLYVSANGNLSFTNASTDFLPSGYVPPRGAQPTMTLVAPWWQDLRPVPNTAHNVFWGVTGTAPNRELVVEWRDVPAFECASDLSNTVKFQVVLSESTDDVIFNYADTHFGGACVDGDFGAEAAVLLQVSQTSSTQFSAFTTGLDDGKALLWSIPPPNTPADPIAIATSLSPSTFVAGSPDTIVTVNGSNFLRSTQVTIGYNGYRPTNYISPTQVRFLLFARDLAYPTAQTQVSIFNPGANGATEPLYFSVTSPGAHITSLSPTTMPAGSFGFPLTITGTGLFGSEDIMWDNGSPETAWFPSTLAAPNVLSGIVSDYLLRTPGTVNVSVFNGPGMSSNPLPFVITPTSSGAGFFAPAPNLPIPPLASQPATPNPAPVQGAQFHHFMGWRETAKVSHDLLKGFQRPRADVAQDISPIQVSGLNPAAGGGSSPAAPPPPGFAFRPRLPADFLPTAVVTGDFNGDGRIDWAIANGGSNNLWIYLGKGDGTSQLPLIISLRGYSPVGMVATDMNGDGKLDLVVAEADSGAVAILLGNGNGTFQPETIAYVPGIPLGLVVADFNGDALADVVVCMAANYSFGQLAFLPGDGRGHLGLPITHTGQVGDAFFETIGLAAADLNNDGLPDIVTWDLSISRDGVLLTEQMPTMGATVFINAGHGSFKSLQLFDPDHTGMQLPPFGHAVTAAALGDVNRDGCIDAVTVDATGVGNYFPGLCNGKFDTAQLRTFGPGAAGNHTSLTDIDGDGNLDLITTSDVVSVQFGDGTGVFSTPQVYRGQPDMYSFAVADLNGDGKKDIISANEGSDSYSVYVNDGAGKFGDTPGGYVGFLSGNVIHATANAPITNFANVDLNGDGKKDFLLFEYPRLSYQALQITTLLSDGAGHYGAPIRSDALFSSDNVMDFLVGDLRNTGHPDIAAIDYSPIGANGTYTIAEARNNGDGTFQRATFQPFPVSCFPWRLASGDFNKDGRLDLLVTCYSTDNAGFIPLLGNGDGTFTVGTPVLFPLASNPSAFANSIVPGDFNHDGNPDILVWGNGLLSSSESNALYLMTGNGNGTFATPRLLFNNFGYFSVADLNHDGVDDLVEIVAVRDAGEFVPLQYSIFLGHPDGTFQPAGNYGPFSGLFFRSYLGAPANDPLQTEMPFLADFNGDGNLDIAAYQADKFATFFVGFFMSGTGPVALTPLLGNGDGTFTPDYLAVQIGRPSVPQLISDTNSDQRADLVQLDGLQSSYHTILATPGPSFDVRLVSNPVPAGNGKLRITLAFPSASGTTISLTASDPNLSIPGSVSLPAGSFTTDVPFQIGSGFDPTHVFAIQAQSGSEIHSAYGTEAGASRSLGFVTDILNHNFVILASQTTSDYVFFVESLGGYSTEVHMACQGLPPGASCQFEHDTAGVSPGSTLQLKLFVTTPPGLAQGTYPFTVVTSDGTFTDQVSASFAIGDFSIGARAGQIINSTGFNTLSIDVNSINKFNSPIAISCNTGFPPGLACPWEGAQLSPIGNYPIYVSTQGLPPGTYQWTIAGSVGSIVHSATVPLYVVGTAPSFSGTIDPQNATIKVGTSGTFRVNVQVQNPIAGSYTFTCSGAPVGSACSMSPSQVTLSSGSMTSTLTVTVNSRPTGNAVRGSSQTDRKPLFPSLFGIAVGLLLVSPFSFRRVRRSAKAGVLMTTFVGVSLLLPSCGGGSSGGGPITPPPPATGVNFNVSVQMSGPGANNYLVGTVSVRVP